MTTPSAVTRIFRAIGRTLARPRFWVGLAVLALWVTVMGWLWWREGGFGGGNLQKMGVSPEVLLVSWTDYDQWMWIEQGGRRIGLTHLDIRMREKNARARRGSAALPGYAMGFRMRADIGLLGLSVPLELAIEAGMNGAFELEAMQARAGAVGQQLLLQAFTEGRSLFYRVKSGPLGEAKSGAPGLFPARDLCGQAPLKGPVFLRDALIPVLTRTENRKPGAHWTTEVSDPLGGVLQSRVDVTVKGKEKVTVEGQEIEAWHLEERVGDIVNGVWYDPRGRLVRRDMGRGMRLVQANAVRAQEAYPEFKRAATFDALDRAAIREHLDPKLRGKPLAELIPPLPGLR